MNKEHYLSEISKERARQDEKWGEQNHHPLFWFSIIGEEFGEMCMAYNKYTSDGDPNHFDNMRLEAVQVAASCVAMLECLDRKSGKEMTKEHQIIDEQTEHTRGPWKVVEETYHDYLGHAHVMRQVVTDYDHPQIQHPVPITQQRTGLPRKKGDPPVCFASIELADARLIAAAPEMLNILQIIMDDYDDDSDEDRDGLQIRKLCDRIDYIIDKVQGKSS